MTELALLQEIFTSVEYEENMGIKKKTSRLVDFQCSGCLRHPGVKFINKFWHLIPKIVISYFQFHKHNLGI